MSRLSSRAVAFTVLVALSGPAPREANAAAGGIDTSSGWLTLDGRPIVGNAQHNGYWGGYRGGDGFWTTFKVRTSLERNAPGQLGPSLTEDLDLLSDAMGAYGYPVFEHNPGLWYDRRRDAHDEVARTDAAVVPPFLEMPWRRSGQGTAWDGLSRYDLTRFNPLYFDRLTNFVERIEVKGEILVYDFYLQHNLLETQAHYVDFPWRPANCIQSTGMPDHIPAAAAFYDVSNPTRRALHEAYIRKVLDTIGRSPNVLFAVADEYTGPAGFVTFWLDTLEAWEIENGVDLRVVLGATLDVQEVFAQDARVDVLDLRYWWYLPDGTLHAPRGGEDVAGRYANGIASAETTAEQIHRQVREQREKHPERALIHRIEANRTQTWAFFMGGGSILVRGLDHEDAPPPDPPWTPPKTYDEPADSHLVLPLYDLVRGELATRLLDMAPVDCAPDAAKGDFCLADPGRETVLAYSLGGELSAVDLRARPHSYTARWFDPRTGAFETLGTRALIGDQLLVHLSPPTPVDWALLLEAETASIFADGFESGDAGAWASPDPQGRPSSSSR